MELLDSRLIPASLVFATLLAGLLSARKAFAEQLVLLCLALNVAADVLAVYLANREESNAICYNCLIPVEIVIILAAYSFSFRDKSRAAVIAVITAYLVYLFISFVLVDNDTVLTDFLYSHYFVGGLFVSLFSYFIWRQAIAENAVHPGNRMLWFSCANFIYYTLAIPILSANQWLVEHSTIALPIYTINKVLYALWAIIIGTGFLWRTERTI